MKVRNVFKIIEVDPLVLVLLPVMFVAGYLSKFLIIFASIFLHEIGHVILALLLGNKVYSIKILPVGLNASIEGDTCSKWNRIAIYLMGPLVNLLLSAFCLVLNSYYLFESDNMRFFILSNLYLAIFNLMPILPLDGGKILREGLAERVGLLSSTRYVRRASLFMSGILVLLGIIQITSSPYNFSLIIIGVYIFLIKNEETEAALMNVKNVIYRRSRLLKKGVYPGRDLVVVKSMHLSEIVKNMDFDRFHIIHVINDDFKLIKTFTEHEIIEGMLKYNSEITFEELIEMGVQN